MKENWTKIETIFHAALELRPEDRAQFLDRECGTEPDLRTDVEELLDGFDSNSEFLEEPAFDVGLKALETNRERSLIGRSFGPYEIVEKLGEGGMGEVYRAIDSRLDRTVALKFLTDALENDGRARRQLAKEARAAAALDHPNICSVFGLEEFEGQHFIVMQHIDGETLSDILGDRELTADEFRSLARQIIDGVAFAHSHGIIHRDLKPGNIMVTTDGRAKILDFGLAKAIAPNPLLEGGDETSRFSINGALIGTVSYMSPEQLRGEKLDFRTDVFSLGIVLHEMLTGENPFARPTQAETIAAILGNTDGPRKLNSHPALKPALEAIVGKCLAFKSPERYQSALELSLELARGVDDSSYLNVSFPLRKRILKFAALFCVPLLLALFFFVPNAWFGSGSTRTLAVLPFASNQSSDEDTALADGLTKSVIDELTGLSGFKIRSEVVTSRYRSQVGNPAAAGLEIKSDAVITGAIERRGEKRVVIVALTRTVDGARIGGESEFEIDAENIIDLQKSIAKLIIAKLNAGLTDVDQRKLDTRETVSETAKQRYIDGRFLLRRRQSGNDVQMAINAFSEAKDLDQNYAKAWAGLADAYLVMSAPGISHAKTPKEAVRLATMAANRALRIDGNLAEAHNSMGMIKFRFEWKWTEAEAHFRDAIALDPEYLPARIGLISLLRLLLRENEALEQVAKIREIDPFSVSADLEMAKIHYRNRNFERSGQLLSELVERSPNDPSVRNVWIYQQFVTGRFSEAIGFLEPKYLAETTDEKRVSIAAPLGFAYARVGRERDARDLLKFLERTRTKFYVPAQEDALIHFGLRDFAVTFAKLDQSCEEKYSSLPFWLNDPVVDEIRNDERTKKLVICANLSQLNPTQ